MYWKMKDRHAPVKRPSVRKKSIMVPASSWSATGTSPGPCIIAMEASQPLESAKRIMKIMGQASLSKTTVSCVPSTWQSRKSGTKMERAAVRYAVVFGERLAAHSKPGRLRPAKSNALKMRNETGTKSWFWYRLAPSSQYSVDVMCCVVEGKMAIVTVKAIHTENAGYAMSLSTRHRSDVSVMEGRASASSFSSVLTGPEATGPPFALSSASPSAPSRLASMPVLRTVAMASVA
mmetsp:Transcript_23420/g.73452  ORF Transcript_23420/g.73452 Transcript_23420/m.73452 type:complete len:234 (+) Transcript_23420:88-789(+)